MNTTQPTYLAAYRHLRQIVGVTVLMLTTYEPDFDGPTGGSRPFTEKINGTRDCWRYLVTEAPRWGKLEAEAILELKSLDDVADAIADQLEYGGQVETEAAHLARAAESRRRKLEGEASRLAARYKVAPGSMEFIAACEAEIDRFRDYRAGMREDGLCIGYGVTHEQWSDEFNASAGDTEAVYEILDWLASECPLLWAKYQEGKLALRPLAVAA
jgi:hypothetical protein